MRTVLILAFLLNNFAVPAQIFEKSNYPQGYFRNPLNIPMSLSGNFGELRSNHYHMGLDIRTNKVENLPVFAAADGYISRVKIEPGGFGRAIYINHPNGYSTVYAHLNNFFPALEQYVKQKQYELESWSIYLEIPPALFPVKKGSQIAYSGNTGGSQAPHLHFEIRNTALDENLNPLLFGFHLPDNTSPVILRLAIYDRTKSIYEQHPRFVSLKRSGNNFNTIPGLIDVNTPEVSLGIGAFDVQSGSHHNGIFEADLYEDEGALVAFQMDHIGYSSTRALNAHIDYRTKHGGGPYLQLLTRLPGYTGSIYKEVSGNGTVDLSDRKIHRLKLVVYDAQGNHSQLNFNLRYDGSKKSADPVNGKMFYPLMIDGFETADLEFYLSERSLYDSVHIRYLKEQSSFGISALHTIGDAYIPLHEPLTVRIRPLHQLNADEKNHTLMLRTSGAKKEVRKVEWKDEWARAAFNEFGKFELIGDSVPPTITPIGFNDGADLSHASRIIISVKDEHDQYKKFRAELDGKWLRFTNDKGKLFVYNFDEKCPKGWHELKISVEDEAGNQQTRIFKIRR